MHRSGRVRHQRQRMRAIEGAFEPRSLDERLASARERRARESEEQDDLPTPEVAAARAEVLSRLIPERELFLRIFSGDTPMSRRRAVLAWRHLAREKRDQQAREQAAVADQSADSDVEGIVVDGPKQVSGNVDDGVRSKPEFILSAAGRRLKLTGTPLKAVQGACAWMCPPAQSMPAGETADWAVCVEPMAVEAAPVMPATWSILLGDYGWPRLERTVSAAGSTVAVGQYRPQDALATITVDRDARSTRVLVLVDAVHAARWVDWLVRAYFGGALLADGWLLLHAAAVSFDGRVVLLGGAPGAGKSSVAHVLCQELGAGFLGDDLVFVAPGDTGGIEAIGWPTRVSLPLDLAGPLDGARLDRRHVSPTWHRERWLASPVEYCAAYGFSRTASGRVAAVVMLERDGVGMELGHLAADDGHLAFMTDRLGLVGPQAAERHAPEPHAVAALLGHLPVLRFTTEQVTNSTAELIWPGLRSLLEAEHAS